MGRIGLEAAEKRKDVPPQYEATVKLPERSAIAAAVFAVREEKPAPVAAVTIKDSEIADDADAPETVEAVVETGLELEPDDAVEALTDADADFAPRAVDLPEQEEDFVGAVHEEHDDKLRTRSFQAQDLYADGKDIENGVVNGHFAPGFWRLKAGESNAARKEEEDKKFTQSILKRQLDQYLKWLDTEIERLGKDIDKVDQLLIQLRNGGRLEVDENGELVDDDAERILRAREERLGIKIDRNDPEALRQALEDERRYMFEEQQRLQRERERVRESAPEINRKIESGEISTMDELRQEISPLNEYEQRLATAEVSKTSVETTAALVVAQGYNEQEAQRAADLAADNSGGGGFVKKKGGISVAQTSEGSAFAVAPISGAFANARDGTQNPATPPVPENNPDAVITPKLA